VSATVSVAISSTFSVRNLAPNAKVAANPVRIDDKSDRPSIASSASSHLEAPNPRLVGGASLTGSESMLPERSADTGRGLRGRGPGAPPAESFFHLPSVGPSAFSMVLNRLLHWRSNHTQTRAFKTQVTAAQPEIRTTSGSLDKCHSASTPRGVVNSSAGRS
jgi:hypothetical protein